MLHLYTSWKRQRFSDFTVGIGMNIAANMVQHEMARKNLFFSPFTQTFLATAI